MKINFPESQLDSMIGALCLLPNTDTEQILKTLTELREGAEPDEPKLETISKIIIDLLNKHIRTFDLEKSFIGNSFVQQLLILIWLKNSSDVLYSIYHLKLVELTFSESIQSFRADMELQPEYKENCNFSLALNKLEMTSKEEMNYLKRFYYIICLDYYWFKYLLAKSREDLNEFFSSTPDQENIIKTIKEIKFMSFNFNMEENKFLEALRRSIKDRLSNDLFSSVDKILNSVSSDLRKITIEFTESINKIFSDCLSSNLNDEVDFNYKYDLLIRIFILSSSFFADAQDKEIVKKIFHWIFNVLTLEDLEDNKYKIDLKILANALACEKVIFPEPINQYVDKLNYANVLKLTGFKNLITALVIYQNVPVPLLNKKYAAYRDRLYNVNILYMVSMFVISGLGYAMIVIDSMYATGNWDHFYLPMVILTPLFFVLLSLYLYGDIFKGERILLGETRIETRLKKQLDQAKVEFMKELTTICPNIRFPILEFSENDTTSKEENNVETVDAIEKFLIDPKFYLQFQSDAEVVIPIASSTENKQGNSGRITRWYDCLTNTCCVTGKLRPEHAPLLQQESINYSSIP